MFSTFCAIFSTFCTKQKPRPAGKWQTRAEMLEGNNARRAHDCASANLSAAYPGQQRAGEHTIYEPWGFGDFHLQRVLLALIWHPYVNNQIANAGCEQIVRIYLDLWLLEFHPNG